MKLRSILLLLIPVPILFACKQPGLNNEKKETIQSMIRMHNINVETKFTLDTIEEKTNLRIKYLGLPETQVQNYIDAHLKVFENEWNKPYDIRKDKSLTLEKYLEYCEANNKNPETYYKFMD